MRGAIIAPMHIECGPAVMLGVLSPTSRQPVSYSVGSGISLIVNWCTPVISISLFSRKSSSPDLLTCSQQLE
jgi:hypothetical protein